MLSPQNIYFETVEQSTPFQVAHVPIAVVGNKIDRAGALSEEQLKWSLGLQHLCTGKGQSASSSILNFELSGM